MTSTRALLIMTALLETVTGVALLTSPSAPVVTAMLVYNVAVAAVLAHASLGLSVTGALLWPAVGLHTALAAWCSACLRPVSLSARS